MGKGGKVTVGYHYRVAYHAGLGIGPIDAFLEFRAGDKTAWAGNLTASGTIHIDQPNLFGGEKDQGGIQSDVDVMFGEADQVPSAYLKQTFGPQVPAWRGLSTLVFKGGRYGAMNPYPQKPAYKILRAVKGWDDDQCWYPQKAVIWMSAIAGAADSGSYTFDGTTAHMTPGYNAAEAAVTVAPGEVLAINIVAGGYSLWPSDGDAPVGRKPWRCTLNVSLNGAAPVAYFTTEYDTAAAALAAASATQVLLATPGNYVIYLWDGDTEGGNNRGNLTFNAVVGPVRGVNPAHILYYARTQNDMGREATTNMHDASFRGAADWYYAQGFGLCTEYDPANESLDDFIARIEKVAGCSMSRSPIDGLWYLDVANGVYDLASLPILTDDDILDFSESPGLHDSAPNSKSVQYFDPAQKESISTAPVQAMALIDAFGTLHDQVSYPEVPTSGLALRLADRDLRADVTPKRAFTLTTTRISYAWRVGTYFRLQSPKRGIADMVCILAEKSTGTLKSGAIKITASQDIYSLATVSFVDTEHGVDTRHSPIAVPIVTQIAIEAPYIVLCATLASSTLNGLDNEAAFVLAAAVDPAASRDYTMQLSPHAADAYSNVGSGEWCPTALIVEGDTMIGAAPRTAFTLASATGLASVDVGSWALWDDEIVRIDAIDSSANTLTLGRGCADTVPAPHAENSRILFVDAAFASEATELIAGESVDIRLLTNAFGSQLDPSNATSMTVALVGRAALPYPPGRVTVAGTDAPASVSGSFTVTWAHRNRVAQADQLVDTSMPDVTPAPNTRYGLRFRRADTSAVLVERADIGPSTADVTLSYAGAVTMELWCIDDIGTSLQMHRRTFDYLPPSSPADVITATAYTPVYDGIIYDGGNAGAP